LLDKLKQGVRNIFTSEKYEQFLKVYSKFHDYSINNTILILMQNPESSHVASYQTWKKLGRNINKGAKGIKVLVPIPYKYQKRVEKIDMNGKRKTEDIDLRGMSFRLGNVFDISQTDGTELPKLTTELADNSDEIKRAIDMVVKTSPVPIYYDKPVGKANGFYHLEDKYIAIRLGMSDSQTFKTLVHEITHAKLHASYERKICCKKAKMTTNDNRVQHKPASRAEQEIQALCSAF
jgi:hypothetical protein